MDILQQVAIMQRMNVAPEQILKVAIEYIEAERNETERQADMKWEQDCENAMFERECYTTSDRDIRNYAYYTDYDVCEVCYNIDCQCDTCADCTQIWHVCVCEDASTKHLHMFGN